MLLSQVVDGGNVQTTGVLSRAVVTAAAAVVTVTLAPEDGWARPRDPGDRAITAAEQVRSRNAAEVGRLSGLLARAVADERRASDRAELAVERYNKAVVDLDAATRRAGAARIRLVAAREKVEASRRSLGRFARASYMQGSAVGSTTSALLDVRSPTDLLQRADLLSYVGRRHLDVLGDLGRSTVANANADSASRAALAEQQAAKAAAVRAKGEAGRALAAARAESAGLRQRRAETERQLRAARVRLNGLVAERRRYQAWQRAQEAAAARERQRQQRIRAEAAARRAAVAAARSTGSGTQLAPPGGRSAPSAPAPRSEGGAGWTASKGQRAADAALRWLGTRYSWGGGNAYGPTYGIDFPGGGAGANDSAVRGFDCSGLTLYAWAQVGVSLPHYSGYQYRSGRAVSRADLMPGDLVFWAYTSDPSTIHHVALYLGGGQVVMAPQSGDVVRIAPMWWDGYLGATRPGA